MLLSPYDVNADWKYGYLDASEELSNSNKSIEELKSYIEEYEKTEGNNTNYDKAYINAYKDYIKEEENK